MSSTEFSFAVDVCEKSEWNEIVTLFDDAAIQQTWSWGALRWSEEQLSHIVVYENAEVVAAAQVVVVELPVLGGGIAHCKFGPMWRRRGRPQRPEVYAYALEAMREAYERRRKLLLRVKPWEVADPGDVYRRCRESVGMRRRDRGEQYETFVVDMSRSMDELRAGFASKWRYNLKKSEKKGLLVKRSNEPDAAKVFMENYAEMRSIKSYVENSEVDMLPSLMADLPEYLRPTVFTAVTSDGRAAASIVVSQLGRVGFYLFGGTAALGRDLGASYLLFWDALAWLKERDCGWFDLVGSKPQTPNGQHGYRQFKSGLVGNANGAEFAMSDWEACSALRSRIVVNGGDWVRRQLLDLKGRTFTGSAARA